MCRGDTTLITFHWGHTVKLPQPDFTQEHTCVNWESLMEWVEPRAIDVFEEGMLVHPAFGRSTAPLKISSGLVLTAFKRTSISQWIA